MLSLSRSVWYNFARENLACRSFFRSNRKSEHLKNYQKGFCILKYIFRRWRFGKFGANSFHISTYLVKSLHIRYITVIWEKNASGSLAFNSNVIFMDTLKNNRIQWNPFGFDLRSFGATLFSFYRMFLASRCLVPLIIYRIIESPENYWNGLPSPLPPPRWSHPWSKCQRGKSVTRTVGVPMSEVEKKCQAQAIRKKKQVYKIGITVAWPSTHIYRRA